MSEAVVARRYAEAAHLIAREEGKEEEWLAGLQAMATLYGNPDAEAFILNSRVPTREKTSLVENALAGVDPKARNLALLLLRRRRTALGPLIAEAYREILDESRGISHARVTSAVPLDGDELSSISKRLAEITGGEVVVKTQVDEDILGGLVVRIGDRLIDGSAKSRLIALRRVVAGGRA